MKPISAEIAEKVFTRISSTQPDEAAELMNRMNKDQPAILAFLMTSGEEVFSSREQEIQLYLGIVIWQIMLEENPLLPTVTIETIEALEEINLRLIENINSSIQSDAIGAADVTFKNFNQKEVFSYILEAIMDESEKLISEENKGLIFFNLKTVIECFDR